MALEIILKTSVSKMAGGVDAVTGVGEKNVLTVGGAWVVGDSITLTFTDGITGLQTQIGAGDITGVTATFCFTFHDKVYLLAGPTVFFSEVGQPTSFNNIQTGATSGFVNLTDHYATFDSLVAIASYQGRLAFFAGNNIQIWNINADPTLWSLSQVFDSIGTRAPLSVQSLGDLDVFFLENTGIRNLRVRDSSLNAFVDDIGSPIDQIIQDAILNSSTAQVAAACGIVEPTQHRYWLFLKDTLYVLSYFRSSKVVAWSRYDATYNLAGVQTAFVPEKFVVFKDRVYCRAGNNLFLYGGVDNNTYDNVVATLETPFMELKTPGTRKQSTGIGVAMIGGWTVQASMNAMDKVLQTIYDAAVHSFDQNSIPFSQQGSHVKFKAFTTGSVAASLSEFVFHFEKLEEE